MRTKRQRQTSNHNYSHSKSKTLHTAETLDEPQFLPHDYNKYQRELIVNDQQVISLIEEQNYTQASLLLHELINQIESNYKINDELLKCFRLYVCYYNLGVIYWRLKDYYEAEKYIDQAIYSLQMTLTFCQYKEEHLIFTLELIKVQLQQCVVFSQNGNHTKAIEMADQAVYNLFESFQVQMAMAQQMEIQLKKNIKNKSKGKINFKTVVLSEAKEKLIYLCELEKSYRLIQESKQQLYEMIEKLYTWKKNLENNEKFIKLTLNINRAEEQRNILGISKSPDWIEQFNIGILLILNPVKMFFKPNLDTFYLLSSNKILQLVIYASVAYFTVATEIRFKQLELDQKHMTSSQKFLKMNDNQRILKCKVLHLKAIELVGRFMPNSTQYISHLITSFNKNYKFYMQKIDEQNSYLIDNQSGKKQKKNIINFSKQKNKRRSQNYEKSTCKRKKGKSKKRMTDSIQKFSKSKVKCSDPSFLEIKESFLIKNR